MSEIAISTLTALTAGQPAKLDVVSLVDVSDTSQASTGTTKKTTLDALNTPMVGQYYPPSVTLADAATVAVDWANGNVQYLASPAAGRTFTFSNPGAGARYVLVILSAGVVTHTWPATVLWPGGTVPTVSAVGKYDVYSFVYVNSKYLGAAVQNF